MATATPKRAKPSVAIVGAGRLGRALAIALSESSYSIKALVARRASKAEQVAGLLPLLPRGSDRIQALGANHLAKLTPTDLVLITTPDDVVENTAARLAALETGKAPGRIVLHTSGALSSEVLAPMAQAGFHTGSLHPLVSVSDSPAGAKALHGAFFCLEGDKAALKLASRIVRDLGGTSFSIRPETKALYHAAAVMASGHLTALFDLATEMLASCGLKQSFARDVLIPLMESAVNNLKVSTPQKALTGTFARGDVDTVQRHLKALSQKDLAEALAVYKLLGLHSMELAEKNGVEPKVVNQIRKLLESAGGRKK